MFFFIIVVDYIWKCNLFWRLFQVLCMHACIRDYFINTFNKFKSISSSEQLTDPDCCCWATIAIFYFQGKIISNEMVCFLQLALSTYGAVGYSLLFLITDDDNLYNNFTKFPEFDDLRALSESLFVYISNSQKFAIMS